MMNFANIGITNTVVGGVTFETEYQTYLDRLAILGYTKPSSGQQVKGNQLVASLKLAGIWTGLDVFYVFAIDGDSDAATVNWKSPSNFQCSKVSAPTFTSNQGYSGNGTSSYLNTGFAPSAGTELTQNDCSFGGYINTTSASNTAIEFGSYHTANVQSFYTQTMTLSGNASYRINQSSTTSLTNSGSLGFFHYKRTASNTTALYKDGSSLGTGAVASAARNAFSIYIGAVNAAGTAANFSNRQVGCYFAGASLTGLESSFYTAWNTYFTSL